MPSTPVIAVIAYDGVQLLDVTGPIEVFETANRYGAAYRVLVVSPDGGDVVAGTRTRLGADRSLARLPRRIDTLVVPGAPDWRAGAGRTELVGGIGRAARRSRRVASVCAGAFLLGAAGLLDGRRAATHWELAGDLAARHPSTTVDADAIFVADGDVYTSAGVTAGIDLCLALVEADHGADLAREVARQLVVFMQRPGGQAQFSTRLTLPPTSVAPLRRLLDDVAGRPAADHSLTALSARAGYSARHLTRVFQRELGMSPARYVERLRVEAAKAELQRGDDALPTVARRAGFRSPETMRRAFLRELGTTPGAYRERFRSTGARA